MEAQPIIKPDSIVSLQVPVGTESCRLDTAMTVLLPCYSRSFFQQIIKQGFTTINGKIITKPSLPVKALDTIIITIPPKRSIGMSTVVEAVKNKNLDIEIIHENEHFLIIHKPANLMVHAPSERSMAVTLVDWLLVHYPDISKVGYSDRPGIVHRIDKDTSGLLVVPRTALAHFAFSKLFKERAMQKTYLAVVEGHPDPAGTINVPIGRSFEGNKMAAFPEYTNPVQSTAKSSRSTRKVRQAITHYSVLEYFDNHALIQATIVTGRTHQIRVHCAFMGHSIVGDPIYGKKSKSIKRQALHAHSLSFEFDGKRYSFHKDVPEDFQELLKIVRLSR